MTMTTLEELARLIEKNAALIRAAEESPIQGWGLNAPPDNDDWFVRVELEPSHGCTSATCSHMSHDPAGPHATWAPRGDTYIVPLGYDVGEEKLYEYFLAKRGQEVRFVRLVRPRFFWAYAEYVSADAVPARMLTASSMVLRDD